MIQADISSDTLFIDTANIPAQAYTGDLSIKKLHIGANVRAIGAYAFVGCSNIAELRIEKGVKRIGEYCFKNCTKLEKIYLPNTKIDIDPTVFGVKPFNWDDMESSLREWNDEPKVAPHFEGVLNIFYDGTWEEYAENGDFVERYLSCSVIENTRIIYVHCKDVVLTYNKWGFHA